MFAKAVYPPKTLKAKIGKRATHRATGYVFEKSANGKWGLVWTPKLLRKIEKAYVKEGMVLRAIADQMGISHSSLQKLIDSKGWMRSKKERGTRIKAVLSKHKTLKRMYLKDKMSALEIAEHFGIDASYLEKYFKKQDYGRSMSDARLNAISKGRVDTKISHNAAWDKYMLMNISDFDMVQYKYAVRGFTNTVMLRYGHIIDPEGKRSAEYHIDHRLSIADGFAKICKDTGIPKRRAKPLALHIMCHPANLKLMPGKDNVVKNARSSITLKELQKAIEEFESEYGEVFNG